jgi:hypothetical protein
MRGRGLMYVIVGLEVLVLSSIVGSQELNRALDSEPGVDLELVRARARKDPFRGAYVWGESALDLDGRQVALPPERLQPGDEVLVFFAVEPPGRPKITRVQRGSRGAPRFSPTSFTIPGTVRGRDDTRIGGGAGLVARVGDPPVTIQLALPASIPIDDSALDALTGPSLIRARLHKGFLEHRYLDDVRLIGRGWPSDVSLVYDSKRDRLVVLAPREMPYREWSEEAKPQTEVFFFDALGAEAGTATVSGRVVEGVVDPEDGHLLALVSDQRWGQSEVSLARIGEDGQVVQRSTLIAFDRILGLEPGGVWTLVGLAPSRTKGAKAPYFVERVTFAGPQSPRLGPFASVPRSVVSRGGAVWVIETEQHRLTRLDLASGRTVREYRDLNGPTDIAVDATSAYVIEANRTQLTRLSADGRALWRVPRFQGLAWILTVPATGEAWAGASTYDGKPAGVVRIGADGSISVVRAGIKTELRPDWRGRRLTVDAVRSARTGDLYLLDNRSIVILSPDGAVLKRLEGYRFPKEQRVRG